MVSFSKHRSLLLTCDEHNLLLFGVDAFQRLKYFCDVLPPAEVFHAFDLMGSFFLRMIAFTIFGFRDVITVRHRDFGRGTFVLPSYTLWCIDELLGLWGVHMLLIMLFRGGAQLNGLGMSLPWSAGRCANVVCV